VRLRIIAGACGGRFIRTPPGRKTRPTPERVREAWLAVVGPEIEGASVLDLFAGSGALGIEALSRGARHAHFVESNRAAADVIRGNLTDLGLSDRATVVTRDAFTFLGDSDAWWDVALADPPYRGDAAARLVRRFCERPFARSLWLEHDAHAPDPGRGASWSRRYGDTRISRFRAPAGEEPKGTDRE